MYVFSRNQWERVEKSEIVGFGLLMAFVNSKKNVKYCQYYFLTSVRLEQSVGNNSFMWNRNGKISL